MGGRDADAMDDGRKEPLTIERIPAAIRRAQCRQAGSEGQLLKQVRQAYKGKVVAGHNLEID